MARPQKAGLDYFPRDTDIHSNRRVRRLVHEHGALAFIVWDYVLCEVYKGHGYYLRWDQHLAFDIADNLRDLTEQQVGEIITACLRLGLLHECMYATHGILTSAGIQERYLKAKKQGKIKEEYSLIKDSSADSTESPEPSQSHSHPPLLTKERGTEGVRCRSGEKEEGSIINAEETPVSSEETPVLNDKTTPKQPLMPQRKVKKRKEKESRVEKSSSPPENNEMNTKQTENLSPPSPSVEPTQPTSPPCVVSPRCDSSPACLGSAESSAGALVSVADASAIYRGPTFIMAREQLCATRQITMPRLHEWITTFDTMLIERGERYKTPNDYARHFRSWLVYQDLTKPPGHTTPQTVKTKTHPHPKLNAGTSFAGRACLGSAEGSAGIPLKSADDLLRERERKRAS